MCREPLQGSLQALFQVSVLARQSQAEAVTLDHPHLWPVSQRQVPRTKALPEAKPYLLSASTETVFSCLVSGCSDTRSARNSIAPTTNRTGTSHFIKRVISISNTLLYVEAALPQRQRLCIALRAMNSEANLAHGKRGRPIVLVGLMGVGKSTIGRRLSQRLQIPFVDADHEIEDAAGLSIPEIFERFGEGHFRDGERRVIARLIDGKAKVIATGGGAFMNPETRALILAKAVSVWIDADLDVIIDRVARRDNRPLLKGKNARKVLTELAQVRNPIYALADLHVRSQSTPHDATVNAIMEKLECLA